MAAAAMLQPTQAILNTTSTGSGAWFRVHPKAGSLSVQVTQTASSVGATLSSSVIIEGSNDGVNPMATVFGTIGFGGATLQSDGFGIATPPAYIRATVNSFGASSAGSAGTPNITALVSAQMRS